MVAFGGSFQQDEILWADGLRVNLIGSFLAIKYGAQAMLDHGRGGSIVCVASAAGLRAGAGGPAYSDSTAGLSSISCKSLHSSCLDQESALMLSALASSKRG